MGRINGHGKQEMQSKGKEVLSGGEGRFIRHSEVYARFVGGVLDRVRKKSLQERDRAFEREFEKMFDTKKVAERLEEYKSHAAFLRTTCVLLFVFLFVMAPLLIRLRGLERIWPVLLVYLIWSLAWIGWSFLRAQRALYPDEKEGRWQQMMVLALSPFSAIRASAVLLRDLFCAFHPLAVSSVLLSKEDARAQAERNLRQSLFRTDGDASSSDAAMRRALESFIPKTGIPREELPRPPRPQSQHYPTYFPPYLAKL